MKNNKNIVMLILVFNFAFFISFGNFFILDKGVNYSGGENSLHKDIINLSHSGKFSQFFVEDYNTAGGDGFQYIKIALGEESVPPYSLRPLYPKFIGSIALWISNNNKATALNLLQPIMGLFNILFLVTAVWFLYLAIRKYINDELISWMLALGLIVGIGTIQTSQFFMLDVISYSIGAIIIYLFSREKYIILSITIALGILIKEVLIIYSLLLLYPLSFKNKKSILLVLKILLFPIISFVGLRLFMEVDPLSIQYGWNISKGEIEFRYLELHFGNLSYTILFLVQIFFTFGFLWIFVIYSLSYKNKRLIFILFGIIISIILANALLASSVLRVIFVVYPVVAILSALSISNLLKQN